MDPSSLNRFGPHGPDLVVTQMAQIGRSMVMFVGWAAFAGLVTAGLCWSCGYGYRCASARIGPPPRLRADPIAREAARGIRRFERLLAEIARAR